MNAEQYKEKYEQYKNGEIIWEKKRRGDKIWWLFEPDVKGGVAFSFDKKKIYYMFQDYPWNMTPEEVEIFDKENPFWADFFKDRKEE